MDLGGSYHLAALDSLLMSILPESCVAIRGEGGAGEREGKEGGEREGVDEGDPPPPPRALLLQRLSKGRRGGREGGGGREEGELRRRISFFFRNGARNGAPLPEAWS